MSWEPGSPRVMSHSNSPDRTPAQIPLGSSASGPTVAGRLLGASNRAPSKSCLKPSLISLALPLYSEVLWDDSSIVGCFQREYGIDAEVTREAVKLYRGGAHPGMARDGRSCLSLEEVILVRGFVDRYLPSVIEREGRRRANPTANENLKAAVSNIADRLATQGFVAKEPKYFLALLSNKTLLARKLRSCPYLIDFKAAFCSEASIVVATTSVTKAEAKRKKLGPKALMVKLDIGIGLDISWLRPDRKKGAWVILPFSLAPKNDTFHYQIDEHFLRYSTWRDAPKDWPEAPARDAETELHSPCSGHGTLSEARPKRRVTFAIKEPDSPLMSGGPRGEVAIASPRQGLRPWPTLEPHRTASKDRLDTDASASQFQGQKF